jgi:hypothetical protein
VSCARAGTCRRMRTPNQSQIGIASNNGAGRTYTLQQATVPVYAYLNTQWFVRQFQTISGPWRLCGTFAATDMTISHKWNHIIGGTKTLNAGAPVGDGECINERVGSAPASDLIDSTMDYPVWFLKYQTPGPGVLCGVFCQPHYKYK